MGPDGKPWTLRRALKRYGRGGIPREVMYACNTRTLQQVREERDTMDLVSARAYAAWRRQMENEAYMAGVEPAGRG